MPASVFHVLTATTPDDPAYEIRPSHWNSAHSVSLALSGSDVIGAFSNAGNVSFAVETNGRITATANVTAAAAPVGVTAGTTSGNLQTIAFGDSNGVSFGLNGSTITASHNGLTSQSNQAFSASGGSSAFQTLNFVNGNGATFTNNAGSVGLSYTVPTVPTAYVSSVNAKSGAVSFDVGSSLSSSGNGSTTTFGLATNITTALQSAGNYLTTARASNDAVGLNSAVSNVTATINSSGLSLDARGYAGTATAITGGAAITLNSGGLSFNGGALAGTNTTFNGTNASASMTVNTAGVRLDLSVAAGGGGGFTGGVSTGGNTSGNTGTQTGSFVLVGGNNITLSVGTAAGGAQTITISGANAGGAQTGISGVSVSNTTYTSGTIGFIDGNGVSFGSGAGQGVSITHGLQFTSATSAITSNALHTSSPRINVSAGTTSNNLSAFVLSNSNGMSFGLNGSTITGSHNGLTTARASNDAIGLNTAQTNVTWTVNSSGLSLNAAGYAGTGTSATNASVTLNSNGLAISVAAPGGAASQTIYATGNTTVNSSGTVALSSVLMRGYGIVSLGTSNGSILVSAPDSTSYNAYSVGFSTGGNTAGNTGFGTDQVVFAGGANITLSGSTNAGSATISIVGGAGGAATGTFYAQSNTTQSSSGTIALSSLNFAGAGIASVGVSNGSVVVSVPSGGGAGDGMVSIGMSTDGNTAGTTGTVSSGRFVFAGTGPVSLSQSVNGQSATLSIGAPATSSLVGTYGVGVSTNGSTISLSSPILSGYLEGALDREWLATQVGQNQPFFQPLRVRNNVQFDEICWPNVFTATSNSSNSCTLSLHFGIYSRNASSLSLITSTSSSYAATLSGTAGSYSIYGGVRDYAIPMTSTLTVGDYFLGFLSRTTTGGGAGMTWSNFQASNVNSVYSGRWSSANNATNQYVLGMGSYTATSTALPSSVAFSQINGSGAANLRPVIFELVSADLN